MPQKISKKIFIYFILFFFLGTLNNKNIQNFEFPKIGEINIYGLEDDNIISIKKDLEYIKKENIFFLKKEKIASFLESNSLVETYIITKKYPAKIEMRIKKTNFLANLTKENRNFILGSNGKLIKSLDIKNGLPTIYGNFTNLEFFKLMDIIKDTDFKYDDIKNFFYFSSGRWDIETKNGVLIKLPKKELKEYFDLSISILKENNFKNIKILDMRQKKMIITNE